MLYVHGLLPEKTLVVGYARTHLDDAKFREQLSANFNKKFVEKHRTAFLDKCVYQAGAYDSQDDFAKLAKRLSSLEGSCANRVFYYAIPPSVFVAASRSLQPVAMSRTGWTRIVVEKPFGRDLDSARALSSGLAALFSEEQIYRIDHYLGKELVQNMLVLRFSNMVFEPLWNSRYISNVQIVFKENFGTEGRGGYFDEYGIIRDVMQNHLLQILSLLCMESPVTLSAEDIRDEKVKVLRAISTLTLENLVVGQYTSSKDGKNAGYLEDKTVPAGSITPTFALAVLFVNNPRWKGTPFILKCGKALDQRKAEIRIQFRNDTTLFSNGAANELVMRLQPDEAMYMKVNSKVPGLTAEIKQVELDLNFKGRFQVGDLPDAYERLILDVTRGDHSLFVREDELDAAWRIFTPVLHQLERDKIKPLPYEYGTRGPAAADEMIKRMGFVRSSNYDYVPPATQAKI